MKLYRLLFLVTVATGLVTRAYRALSSLTLSDGLQDDLTSLVGLSSHHEAGWAASVTLSLAQELASFARYRCQESLGRPRSFAPLAKCVPLRAIKQGIVLKADGVGWLLLLDSVNADRIEFIISLGT